jgi:uncharacterized membrane protein
MGLMGYSGVNKIRLYTPVQVAVSSLLGGPCAAVFVLWKNFQGLGNSSNATRTIVWGAFLALLVFLIIPFLPEKFPNFAIPAAYTGLAVSVNRQYQLSKKDILESEQHEIRSNWNVFGVSIGFLVATMAVLLSWILLLDFAGIVSLG